MTKQQLIPIKTIKQYKKNKDSLKPIFGKVIAYYHPIEAELFVLEPGDDTYKNQQISEEKFKIETHWTNCELYIKLTEGCNFSCPGCATATDKIKPAEARTLDQARLELYLESFFKSAVEKGFTQATIKWAGGEPLLQHSFRLIEKSQTFIKELSSRFPQLKIKQTVLTNGVFLDETKINFFKKHNFHVSVSLWGTAKYQDMLRRPRNKMQSFETIAQNIGTLQKSKTSYNVNHVVTTGNCDHFSEFIELMWDTQSPNFIGSDWPNPKPVPLGFNLYRPQAFVSSKTLTKQYKKIEKGLHRGFAQILDLIQRDIPIQALYKFDYLNLLETITTACGTGYAYVAVGPEGASPCHEGLFQMKSNLSEIEKGENLFDLAQKQLPGNREKLMAQNIHFSNPNDPLRYHGGQGCPRLALKENGTRGKTASTNQLYQNIYQELLSLETMRLLKTN